jgi:hypothetical protein
LGLNLSSHRYSLDIKVRRGMAHLAFCPTVLVSRVPQGNG